MFPSSAIEEASDSEPSFPVDIQEMPEPLGLSEPSVKGTVHSRSRRARISYPVGSTVCGVGRKGVLPICGTCGGPMERDSIRFVVKTIENAMKGWSKMTSYHFVEQCVATLPRECLSQATAHLAGMTADNLDNQ